MMLDMMTCTKGEKIAVKELLHYFTNVIQGLLIVYTCYSKYKCDGVTWSGWEDLAHMYSLLR